MRIGSRAAKAEAEKTPVNDPLGTTAPHMPWLHYSKVLAVGDFAFLPCRPAYDHGISSLVLLVMRR